MNSINWFSLDNVFPITQFSSDRNRSQSIDAMSFKYGGESAVVQKVFRALYFLYADLTCDIEQHFPIE